MIYDVEITCTTDPTVAIFPRGWRKPSLHSSTPTVGKRISQQLIAYRRGRRGEMATVSGGLCDQRRVVAQSRGVQSLISNPDVMTRCYQPPGRWRIVFHFSGSASTPCFFWCLDYLFDVSAAHRAHRGYLPNGLEAYRGYHICKCEWSMPIEAWQILREALTLWSRSPSACCWSAWSAPSGNCYASDASRWSWIIASSVARRSLVALALAGLARIGLNQESQSCVSCGKSCI